MYMYTDMSACADLQQLPWRSSRFHPCLYDVVTVYCPDIAGYSTSVGQDHPGDDIGCYGGTDFSTAASACNSDPSCTAFNVLPNDGFFCTKVASSPLIGDSRVCFYTKNTAGRCRVVPMPSSRDVPFEQGMLLCKGAYLSLC